MEEFPSGQRGQTVNLLRFASVVRIHPPPPRRSKVRFAPTSFYACGKKRRHPPASLLLLSKPNPLRWASVWCRRFAAILFHHNKLLIFDLSSCSSQASYRLRRAFSFYYKAYRALILLLLASKLDPLSLGSSLAPPLRGGRPKDSTCGCAQCTRLRKGADIRRGA